MSQQHGTRRPAIFTINTRSSDPAAYWSDFTRLIGLTEKAGFDGILCFSANETLIDPWLAAQHIIASSTHLAPIVAVNPAYMHPFSAAKMVSSLGYMHSRRVILNLITGSSARDRQVLQDDTDHAGRYARLAEYAGIVQQILRQAGPLSFEGRFYRLKDALLAPPLPPELQPGFLVAGHSDASARLVEATGAVHLRMLDPQLADGLPRQKRGLGIHLGLIARDGEDAAWQAAHERFPADPELEGILDFVMEGNDSVWKRKLYEQIRDAGPARPGYWLEPFGQLRADCPYLVGSYEGIAEILARHVLVGTEWIILDLPPDPWEFNHAAKVVRLVQSKLDLLPLPA